MRTLAQGVPLAAGNEFLVFLHASRAGHLTDLEALQYQVFRTANDTEELAPVQVWPAVVGTRATVDVDGVDRIGKGRYSASGWTPAAGAGGKGKHFIRWFWTSEVGDPELTADLPFDVQAFSIPPGFPFYSSLSDLRAAGLTVAQASDAKAVAAIKQASAFIERITQQFFEPRYLGQYHDGRGSTGLLFNLPIIALDELKVTTRPVRPSDQPIDADFIRIYNRHLSGMLSPDDRRNPKIELFSMTEDWIGVRPFSFSRLVFPRAQQNVHVTGIFGFTDPNGTPFGATPPDIELATLLLVPRYVPAMRADAMWSGRLLSESTRDQSYTLQKASDLGLPANLTGDPAIDSILASYLRPMMLGSA